MWPWGHLALGYVLYAGVLGVWRRQRPAAWPVVALDLGTQVPDLVDKPLAYWTPLLPAGRSLTHSIVVFAPVGLAILALAWYVRRSDLGGAFMIGWGSHLVGDSLKALLTGAYGQLTFLLWPLRPLPASETAGFHVHWEKLVGLFADLDADALLNPGADLFVLQLWLFAFTCLLWVVQGMPPMLAAWQWAQREYGLVRRG